MSVFDKCIGDWSFYTGEIKDYSSYGADGVFSAGNTIRWCRNGDISGLHYGSGGTSKITVTPAGQFNVTDELTIEALIGPRGSAPIVEYGFFMESQGASSSGFQYWYNFTVAGSLYLGFNWGNGATYPVVTVNVTGLNHRKVIHAVVTCQLVDDDMTVKHFINGGEKQYSEVVESTSWVGKSSGTAFMGSRNAPYECFKRIHHFTRMYHGFATDEEMFAMYKRSKHLVSPVPKKNFHFLHKQPVKSGSVLDYDLRELNNKIVHDKSGNEHDGVVVGGITPPTEKGIWFDEKDSGYVSVSGASLNVTDEVTIMVVYRTPTTAVANTLRMLFTGDHAQSYFALATNGAAKPYLSLNIGGSQKVCDSLVSSVADRETLAIATFKNGEKIRMFVDGVLRNETGPWTGTMLGFGSGTKYVGRYSSLGYGSFGHIKTLKIFNRRLSDAEVAALYEAWAEELISEDLVATKDTPADLSSIGSCLPGTEWCLENAVAIKTSDHTIIPNGSSWSAIKKVQPNAYGSWEFSFRMITGCSDIARYAFAIESSVAIENFNGYLVYLHPSYRNFVLAKATGGYTLLMYTADNFFDFDTNYTFRVTRDISGKFTVYYRKETGPWMLVPAYGGSNPVTDSTYKLSVASRITGSKIKVWGMKQWRGVVPPI